MLLDLYVDLRKESEIQTLASRIVQRDYLTLLFLVSLRFARMGFAGGVSRRSEIRQWHRYRLSTMSPMLVPSGASVRSVIGEACTDFGNRHNFGIERISHSILCQFF
jgi:hypothetical protein